MQKKNKIRIQTIPIRSPSPDIKNNNRIAHTSIQANSIKSYLHSIKNINQKEKNKSDQYSYPDQIQTYSSNKSQSNSQSYSSQEALRKRIIELEKQNNQFRLMSKEFVDLTNQNKELQQKMLMLLSELEYSNSQLQSQSKGLLSNSKMKIQKLDAFSTIQHIWTQPQKLQGINYSYQVQQFENEQSTLQNVMNGPFNNLKIGNKVNLQSQKQIKAEIGVQINNQLQSFQQKFINLVKFLDSQLKQLKIDSQEINHLTLQRSSSSESNIEVRKEQYPNLSLKIHQPINQFRKQKIDYHSRQRKQEQNSMIDIKMQNISDSQLSLGQPNTLKKQIYHKSQFNDKIQNNNKKINQSFKHHLDQADSILKNVLQSIENVKLNLVLFYSEQNRTKQIKWVQLQNKIFQKLQGIITTFFPHKKMQTSSLICQQNFRQSILLREKMKFTNSDKLNQTQFKDIKQCYNWHLKSEGERIDNPLLPLTTHDFRSQQFQQTKRKLLEIIEIMKSINQQYRKTLSHKLKTQHQVQ